MARVTQRLLYLSLARASHDPSHQFANPEGSQPKAEQWGLVTPLGWGMDLLLSCVLFDVSPSPGQGTHSTTPALVQLTLLAPSCHYPGRGTCCCIILLRLCPSSTHCPGHHRFPTHGIEWPAPSTIRAPGLQGRETTVK